MNAEQRRLIAEAWEEAKNCATVGDTASISVTFQDLVQDLRKTDKKLDDQIRNDEQDERD